MWDPLAQCLYWVDILARQVHRFDPVAGDDEVTTEPFEVAAVAPAVGGGLVVARGTEIAYRASWGDTARPVAGLADQPSDCRFNDGKCDPAGRLWIGTMTVRRTPGVSALYRLADDASLHAAVEGVTLSNGLAWSPDGRIFYYIDTPTHAIDAFDFDPRTGDISSRRRLVAVHPRLGNPDGMVVDASGAIWVALARGGAIHRYEPDGQLVERVELPVAKVTSCGFGGADLDLLFITSACVAMSEEELMEQPHAGALLCIRPDVPGLAQQPWNPVAPG